MTLVVDAPYDSVMHARGAVYISDQEGPDLELLKKQADKIKELECALAKMTKKAGVLKETLKAVCDLVDC
jgi:hypothetical protein